MATKGDLSRMYRNFSGSKGPQDFMSKADVDAAIAANAGKLNYLHMIEFVDTDEADVLIHVVSSKPDVPEVLSDIITKLFGHTIVSGMLYDRCQTALSMNDETTEYKFVVMKVSDEDVIEFGVTTAGKNADVLGDTIIDLTTGEQIYPNLDE